VGGRSERLAEASVDATPGVPPRPASGLDSLARRLSELPAGHPSSTAADTRQTADDPSATYWDQVDHLEQLWQQHLERWPDRPRSEEAGQERLRSEEAERAEAGPPGSWRGDGGRYLSPDQNAAADKLITKLREPEPAITADLREIEQNNSLGGYLTGLEHRLKGTTRLKEKIAEKLEFSIGATADEAVAQISDAVRYTFCFGSASYASGCRKVRDELESGGYRMTYSQNHWIGNDQYKGINTRWETMAGDRFELQFHTTESVHAKQQLTHRSYERLRAPDLSRAERAELEDYQRAVIAAIPRPAGAAEVPGIQERT
jgi:hypothetical protein